jgi:FkbM family methyltransferase
MKDSTLFLFKSFNDIDHISPLLWYAMEKNQRVIILWLGNDDINSYKIIAELIKKNSIKVISINHNSQTIKFLSWNLFSSLFFLKTNSVERIVSEWFNPSWKDVRGHLFIASRILGIKTFCLAFDKSTGIGIFNHYKTNSESSTSQLNSFVDHNNKKFEVKLNQDIIIETVSSFVNRAKVFPNHIKIDVDGIEFQILEGFKEIIKDERLKSVLVEITGETSAFKKFFSKQGFKIVNITSTSRKDESFNYIFER